jgi:hypothetical protein
MSERGASRAIGRDALTPLTNKCSRCRWHRQWTRRSLLRECNSAGTDDGTLGRRGDGVAPVEGRLAMTRNNRLRPMRAEQRVCSGGMDSGRKYKETRYRDGHSCRSRQAVVDAGGLRAGVGSKFAKRRPCARAPAALEHTLHFQHHERCKPTTPKRHNSHPLCVPMAFPSPGNACPKRALQNRALFGSLLIHSERQFKNSKALS